MRISFELHDEDIICSTFMDEDLSKEEQIKLAEKFANLLILLQTGNLMSQILHSLVEAGMITDQKKLSELIIKKLVEAFSAVSDTKPIVTPSEAFLFKERQ